MHIIIGLGNPGSWYAETRHNVGFAVVDSMAEEKKLLFKPGKGEYWSCRGSDGDKEFILAKPAASMNNSGYAVRQIIDEFGGGFSDCIIVYDDIHLPLGSLRFRMQGSDGGHRGMGSVIYHLQSEEIQRLRCGIGKPAAEMERLNSADYVLSPFDPDELKDVRSMILHAQDALHDWLREGIGYAMNRWNAKVEEE